MTAETTTDAPRDNRQFHFRGCMPSLGLVASRGILSAIES
jgi:hypothetical protein